VPKRLHPIAQSQVWSCGCSSSSGHNEQTGELEWLKTETCPSCNARPEDYEELERALGAQLGLFGTFREPLE